MAKVDATRHYGAEVELTGAAIEEALEAAQAYVDGARCDVRPPVRGSARHRRPGDDRARARRPGAGRRDGAASRSAAAGSRPASRSRCAREAGRAHRRRAGGGHAAGGPGYTIADGIAVKKPGRADDVDPRARARRDRRGHDEEISEAIVVLLERTKLVVEGGGAVGVAALLAGQGGRQRRRRAGALRRQHRRDAAHLGHAARARRRGPLPRVRTRVPDRPGELAKLLRCSRRSG